MVSVMQKDSDNHSYGSFGENLCHFPAILLGGTMERRAPTLYGLDVTLKHRYLWSADTPTHMGNKHCKVNCHTSTLALGFAPCRRSS